MRLGPRKRVALVALVAATAAAVAVMFTWGADALIVPLVVGQLLTLGVVGFLAVQVERLRSRTRRDAAVLAAVERHAAQRHDEVLRTVEALAADVGALRQALSGGEPVTRMALHQRLERTEDRFVRRLSRTFVQLESLQALYHEMQPVRALPPTGGWAAGADLLLTCWRLTLEERPATILECGSGVSTLVLAAACQRVGRGRVIALDHEPRFAAATRDLLAQHGLEAWAEVRDAPLEPLDGPDGAAWYRRAAVPEGPIDLVLVDGPPSGKDPEARAPALPVLHDRLAPGVVVVVDDHRRPGERAVVDGWLAAHPEFERRILQHEKGTAILRREGAVTTRVDT